MQRLAISAIELYQHYVSPWLPSACRFHPTCSEFTKQAIVRHGLLRGLRLGGGRILRCHPLHPGGFDPVPDERSVRAR
jgi:putative membrane protein insertion efficiency factor